ncbi:hypothetical protein ScPMuIL_001466 [Solemya velum]
MSVLGEFQRHYSTKEVDLVFVLDRSSSVPVSGWASMVNFVRSLLGHFTVDGSNTRVAVISYSTTASVDVNDLGSATENKCSLMGRLNQRLSRKVMSGYTATYQALYTAGRLLYRSRTEAKKAVFVLTDGESNIGYPPVRASLELRSLQWNTTWNSSRFGPQLEIYAFGIKDAYMPELTSVAPAPNHTYYIPDFRMFRDLARSLHFDKQGEVWQVLVNSQRCDGRCSPHAMCTCGTRSGQYLCVCKQGYQGNGVTCTECPRGTFKDVIVPGKCQRCPVNTTTVSTGAHDVTLCSCQPPYHMGSDKQGCLLKYCEVLPDITHGHKFHVEGAVTDERPDRGQLCVNSAGDSCHYRCDQGYRLTGHPGQVCQSNGSWTGNIPKCNIIDCHTLQYHGEVVSHGTTDYLNDSTTYGSVVNVTCDIGWRQFGDRQRTCTQHGIWSGTQTWCIEARCPSLPPLIGGEITPQMCSQTQQKPVACPRGTYHVSVNETCELCPLGQYQDDEGQESCLPCPNATTTLAGGAKNETECRASCGSGHRSPSGLEPCTPCDIGYYQSNVGMTECVPCLENETTTRVGAERMSQCGVLCQSGFYNLDNPCLLCSASYHPGGNETDCLPTNCDTETENCTGKFLVYFCFNLTQGPCENGGSCIQKESGFHCVCLAGFTGKQCQIQLNYCEFNSCHNNATCVEMGDNYRCNCMEGYTGQQCDIDIDECSYSPCQHGSSCLDLLADYQCYCNHGYHGRDCQYFSECSSNPCLHGDCEDLEHGYMCNCHRGFTGRDCSDADHCLSTPCGNGGTCVPDSHSREGYLCICLQDWTGKDCEVAVREACDTEYCSGQGQCVSLEDDYACRCHGGFGGNRCQLEISNTFDLVFLSGSLMDYVSMPVSEDLSTVTISLWMQTNDFTNQGTIFSYIVSGSLVFSLMDYSGLEVHVGNHVTETGIPLNDGWWHHLCLAVGDNKWDLYINGTLAESRPVTMETISTEGGTFIIGQSQDLSTESLVENTWKAYIGEISQLNVFSSLNRSEISQLASQSSCDTKHGDVIPWTSVIGWLIGHVTVRNESHCLDTNECLTSGSYVCGENRQCRDLIGSFECGECIYGYTGEQCMQAVNECDQQVCQNEASCQDGPLPYDYQCLCRENYTGRNCEDEIEGCLSQPCKSGQECITVPGGYRCLCDQQNSKVDNCVTMCQNNICLNNGSCVIHQEQMCICSARFTGSFCQINVDTCPCRNGGTCVFTDHGSSCICPPSWKGDNCETNNLPDCDLQPCLNGGTCVDSPISGYSCLCPDEDGKIFGPNCEVRNVCSSSPCLNAGDCVVISDDSFHCICPTNFKGHRCGIEKFETTNMPNNSVIPDAVPKSLECEELDVYTGDTHHRKCSRSHFYTHCFASWEIKDGQVRVLAKGCSSNLPSCRGKEECVGDYEKGAWFCCCDRSMCNVNISSSREVPSEKMAMDITLYLILGLVCVILGFAAILIWFIIRLRRPMYRKATKLLPHTLNNSNDVVLNTINNPVFSSEDDNVYAELDVDPYYKSAKSEAKDLRNSSQYSSKRSNKDCNIERAAARKNSDLSISTLNSSVKGVSIDDYMTPLSMKNDSTLMEGRRKDTKELLPTRKLSKKTMEELKFEKYKLPRQAQTNLDTSNKPFYMNVNQETTGADPASSPGYITMTEKADKTQPCVEYLEVLPPLPEDLLSLKSRPVNHMYEGDISTRGLPPVPKPRH